MTRMCSITQADATRATMAQSAIVACCHSY